MDYRAHGGYIDLPSDKVPEDPHLDLAFDYEFAGKEWESRFPYLFIAGSSIFPEIFSAGERTIWCHVRKL